MVIRKIPRPYPVIVEKLMTTECEVEVRQDDCSSSNNRVNLPIGGIVVRFLLTVSSRFLRKSFIGWRNWLMSHFTSNENLKLKPKKD